jgi:hypothetical protein
MGRSATKGEEAEARKLGIKIITIGVGTENRHKEWCC